MNLENLLIAISLNKHLEYLAPNFVEIQIGGFGMITTICHIFSGDLVKQQ